MSECWTCMGACDTTNFMHRRNASKAWLLHHAPMSSPLPPPVIVSQPRQFVVAWAMSINFFVQGREKEGGARFRLAGVARPRSGSAQAGLGGRGRAQVIRPMPAPTRIRQEDRVDTYLLALGALCVELARAPQLLPVFLRVIKLAPFGPSRELRRRAA